MLVNNLKKIRMQQFMMSKKEFAQYVGIGEPQFYRYERGAAQPSLEVAIKISNALEKSVNEIWKIYDPSLQNPQ